MKVSTSSRPTAEIISIVIAHGPDVPEDSSSGRCRNGVNKDDTARHLLRRDRGDESPDPVAFRWPGFIAASKSGDAAKHSRLISYATQIRQTISAPSPDDTRPSRSARRGVWHSPLAVNDQLPMRRCQAQQLSRIGARGDTVKLCLREARCRRDRPSKPQCCQHIENETPPPSATLRCVSRFALSCGFHVCPRQRHCDVAALTMRLSRACR